MQTVIRLRGIRTDAYTGQQNQVELTAEVRRGYRDQDWLHLQGGPTGYESLSLHDLEDILNREGNWLACMGTPYLPGGNAWDRLEIPHAELVSVRAQIGEMQ